MDLIVVSHSPLDSFFQGKYRRVAQSKLGLGDVEVSRQCAEAHAWRREIWLLAEQSKQPFQENSEAESESCRQYPDLGCINSDLITIFPPDHPWEVPEIYRLVIGDEESLAVNSFGVQGCNLHLVCL